MLVVSDEHLLRKTRQSLLRRGPITQTVAMIGLRQLTAFSAEEFRAIIPLSDNA